MAVRSKTIKPEAEVQAPEVEVVTEAPKAETKSAKPAAKEKAVLFESTHQMSIFTDYIHNSRQHGAELVVTNMGYGDVYVSEFSPATVGASDQRLTMGESRTFVANGKFYAASASQPVLQVIELG